MLPIEPSWSRHHVNRSRRNIEHKTVPGIVGRSSKAEPARRSQRDPKYPIELWLIAVPPDPGANIVFGAENLGDTRARAAKRLDPFDQSSEPNGCGLRRKEAAQRIIVTPAEGRHTAFALVLAELEGL